MVPTAPVYDCITAASALSSEFFEAPQECSIVLRVDPHRARVLDWQAFCGPAVTVSSAAVRSQVAEGLDPAQPLSTNQPLPGLWLAEPRTGRASADTKRIWGVVAAYNGMLVLGQVMDGARSDSVHPPTWRDIDPLGEGCPPWGLTAVAGYDAVERRELTPEECTPALSPISTTALPPALWSRGGMPRDTSVLSFGREHGKDSPVFVIINASRPEPPAAATNGAVDE
jgi:hypothetical protein